jgi:lipopolysaccharide transport system ATP-binding protein
VDEVLAVGDAAFQQKCLGKMGSVVSEGRTVLFVSHNMAAVAALCTRAMLLDNGQVKLSGPPETLIEAYLAKARDDASTPVAERRDRQGSGRMRFTRISVLNERLEPLDAVISGQTVSIGLEYELPDGQTLNNAAVQIKFSGALGQPLFACLSTASSRDSLTLTPGGRLICKIPRLPLMPGIYTFTIWCTVGDILEDYVSGAGSLSVADGDYFGTGKLPPAAIGDFLVTHQWFPG